MLADEERPESVYAEVVDANLFRSVQLRVRPSNSSVLRLCVGIDRLHETVLKFPEVTLSIQTNGFFHETALVDTCWATILRLAPDDELDENIILAVRDQHPHDALSALALAYRRLVTPHSALLVLCDARCAELCMTVFADVAAVMREYDSETLGVERVGDEKPYPFAHWRTETAVVVKNRAGQHEWTLLCCVGPLSTRDAVRARLQSLEPRRKNRVMVHAQKYLHVLAYQPPPEREVDVWGLVNAPFERLDTQRPGRGNQWSTELPLPTPSYWKHERNAGEPLAFLLEQVDQDAEAYVTAYAPRFLQPLECSRYRWSHQSDVCRDYVIVLLDAHQSDAPHLPPYVVLEILEWTDEEYIWRSTEFQRTNLIINVARSMKRVRAARAATAPPEKRSRAVESAASTSTPV